MNENYVVARDPYGVRALYYGFGPGRAFIMVASEVKSLSKCTETYPFPPGHYGMIEQSDETVKLLLKGIINPNSMKLSHLNRI